MLAKLKDYYLDAIDLIDDHPHVTFWVIVGIAVTGLLV